MLDAKLNIDSNAHTDKAFPKMRDFSQEDERESKAAEWDLGYVALDGNIGCMVNGAGLAMVLWILLSYMEESQLLM